MIRHTFLKVDSEEPAVCDIHLNFLFQLSLGIDSVQITEQEHFYENHRID